MNVSMRRDWIFKCKVELEIEMIESRVAVEIEFNKLNKIEIGS